MVESTDKSDLIEELKRVHNQLGRPPTSRDMKSDGEYSATPYNRVFDSWADALRKASIEPTESQKRRCGARISKSHILEELKRVYRRKGKVTKRLVDDIADFSHGTVQNRFDSFNDALEIADIPKTHEIGISKKVNCAACGKEIEREPNEIRTKEYHFCSVKCTHEPVIEVECATCGRKSKKSVSGYYNSENHFCSKQCRIESYYEVADCAFCGNNTYINSKQERDVGTFCDHVCYGKWLSENRSGEDCPTHKSKVEKTCSYCNSIFKVIPSRKDEAKFCSRECSYDHRIENGLFAKENHPRWNPDKEVVPFGENWQKKRQSALERDEYECVCCGMNQDEHLKKYNQGLNVHHVIPRRKFYNAESKTVEQANNLDNLVTLCSKHHREWEGVPVRPVSE